MTGIKYSAEIIKKIKELNEEGKSYKQISRALNISYNRLVVLCHRKGIKIKNTAHNRSLKNLLSHATEIKLLLERKKTYTFLAHKYNITRPTIANFIKNYINIKEDNKQLDLFLPAQKLEEKKDRQESNDSSIIERLENLEMQIEILIDTIKEIQNVK